jgi:hypothetical protein
VINSSSAITVNIEARYVPPGTVPKLTILSESVGDQVIDCPTLQGSLQLSNSTASLTFHPGGSRGYVRATWAQ